MPRAPASLLVLHTSWGPVRLTARAGRLHACDLPMRRRPSPAPPRIGRAVCEANSAADRRVLRSGESFIRALCAGRTAPCPALAPARTPFAAACRRAMQRLARGECVSYGELARRAGQPAGARAAGQACARNPLPLFVPCHRVRAAGGGPGGFSAGAGWKSFLLAREAAS